MTDERYLILAKGQFRVEDNPTEDQINAKAQELKDAEADRETKKASAKQKLLDLGLTEEEIKLTFGI